MRTGGYSWGRLLRRPAWWPIIALAVVAALGDTATAQGLFETLFGSGARRAPTRAEPPPHAYADPGRDSADPLTFFRGHQQRISTRPIAGSAFCVRLCDGRYFPLQPQGDIAPAELCHAFCPAARTKVLFGSDIGTARAQDGTRYASLDNAFVYRERLVSDCTCNGKTPFGLAMLDPRTDPTLRPGDLIATKDGLMAFQASRWRRGGETAQFTPLDRSRPAGERPGSIAAAARQ